MSSYLWHTHKKHQHRNSSSNARMLVTASSDTSPTPTSWTYYLQGYHFQIQTKKHEIKCNIHAQKNHKKLNKIEEKSTENYHKRMTELSPKKLLDIFSGAFQLIRIRRKCNRFELSTWNTSCLLETWTSRLAYPIEIEQIEEAQNLIEITSTISEERISLRFSDWQNSFLWNEALWVWNSLWSRSTSMKSRKIETPSRIFVRIGRIHEKNLLWDAEIRW